MSSTPEDIRSVVARHERQLAELRAEIAALRDGHAREQLQSELDRRLAELEAEIHLQDLQEDVDREAAKKGKKKFFRR